MDESNIHKQEGLSSIALVAVASLEDLQKFDAFVLATEGELRLIRPFHWNSTSWPLRIAFTKSVAKTSFGLRIALLPNPINIWRAIEITLPRLLAGSYAQQLIIDGSKPKSYTRELKKILRDQNIHINTIRTEASASRPTLRVADCMANIVRLHAERSSEQASLLYALIRDRIEVLHQ